MIAMFLFLVMALSALALHSEGFRRQPKALEFTAGEDGLVALPRPDQVAQTPRMASDKEMKFAAQYLHLGGLSLIVVGVIARLRMTGTIESATDSGLLPCLFGTVLGLVLVGAGYRLSDQGQRLQALALMCTGTGVLAVVLGAAHFKFHLLPLAPLLVLTLLLIGVIGSMAVKLSSPGLAGALIVGLFVAPMAVGFEFPSAGVALAYLMSINLGVTAVAYLKRWDAFLIGSLVGSYALYFQSFGLSHPSSTLTFLVLTYGLFLLSGNLFHFWKRSASEFHLGLSMVNPILFACASYMALLRLPNGWALGLYTSIAMLHVALTWWATRITGQGPAYNEIARGNWGLTLLFGTAATSFVAHIDTSADNFGYVALLLLGQVYLLSYLAPRLPSHLSDLARGGSYWALLLASIQLVALVPFMEQPNLWRILGGVLLLGYFFWQEESEVGLDRRLALNLSVLTAVAVACQAAPPVPAPTDLVMIAACAAVAALLGYRKYPFTLSGNPFLALALTAAVVVACFIKGWAPGVPSLPLYLCIGILALQIPLCSGRGELWVNKHTAFLACFALGFRAIGSFQELSWVALGWTVLWAVMCYRSPEDVGYEALLSAAALGIACVSVMAPHQAPIELTLRLACLGILAGVGLQAWLSDRRTLGGTSLVLALVLALQCSFALHSGAFSTLVWALLGFGLPRLASLSPRLGLPLLFAAFLKSIVWDTNFEVLEKSWRLTNQLDVSGLLACAFTVACFGAAAHWCQGDLEYKTHNTLFALICTMFGVTRVLVHTHGSLDDFQIVLSGFWACASALFVAYGINQEDKLFRLFGLALLVACIGKIMAIDLWLLEAVDRTAPTLLLGALMMGVSHLYQANRERLVKLCLT